jgi:hypothetical protein
VGLRKFIQYLNVTLQGVIQEQINQCKQFVANHINYLFTYDDDDLLLDSLSLRFCLAVW